ncbi:tetratricopeptide repeat protein [bacterium]|nr:tetratricopeptide repeat protein [bacterium]
MLKARKKISRREIKEDPLVTAYVRVQKVLQRFSRQINIGLVAVAVIVTIVIFDNAGRKNNEKSAESAIAQPEQVYLSRNYERAIQELMPVTQEYAGTSAAGRAVFYLANAYYEIGQFDDASTYYAMYLSDYGQIDYFKVSSQAGIAACDENKELFLEAAQAYEKAAGLAGDQFSRPFHLKNAARCYELANDPAKARALYQQVLDQYPEYAFKDEITFQMESL